MMISFHEMLDWVCQSRAAAKRRRRGIRQVGQGAFHAERHLLAAVGVDAGVHGALDRLAGEQQHGAGEHEADGEADGEDQDDVGDEVGGARPRRVV